MTKPSPTEVLEVLLKPELRTTASARTEAAEHMASVDGMKATAAVATRWSLTGPVAEQAIIEAISEIDGRWHREDVASKGWGRVAASRMPLRELRGFC